MKCRCGQLIDNYTGYGTCMNCYNEDRREAVFGRCDDCGDIADRCTCTCHECGEYLDYCDCDDDDDSERAVDDRPDGTMRLSLNGGVMLGTSA